MIYDLGQDTNEDHYLEEWVLIIGDMDWTLDKREAGILKEAIRSGNRGMVVFDEMVVNIPFIKEFYRKKRYLDPKYQIREPEPEYHVETEEEIKARQDSWERARLRGIELEAQLKVASMPKKLSPKEFEARRKMLLEQAEKL